MRKTAARADPGENGTLQYRVQKLGGRRMQWMVMVEVKERCG